MKKIISKVLVFKTKENEEKKKNFINLLVYWRITEKKIGIIIFFGIFQ